MLKFVKRGERRCENNYRYFLSAVITNVVKWRQHNFLIMDFFCFPFWFRFSEWKEKLWESWNTLLQWIFASLGFFELLVCLMSDRNKPTMARVCAVHKAPYTGKYLLFRFSGEKLKILYAMESNILLQSNYSFSNSGSSTGG